MTASPFLATARRVYGRHTSLPYLYGLLQRGESCPVSCAEWCAEWCAMMDQRNPNRARPDCRGCGGAGWLPEGDGSRFCGICHGYGTEPVQRAVCRCGGLGWVGRDLPLGHPQFGRLVRCPDCGDGQPSREPDPTVDPVLALRDAGAPELYRTRTVGSFLDQPDRSDSQIAAALAVVRWASLTAERGMVLAGPTSTGKTTLAAAGLGLAAQVQPRVRFVSWLALVGLLYESFGDERPGMSLPEIVALYGQVPVLALDDFGTSGRPAKDKAVELAEALWDARVGRGGTWTLVTTNLEGGPGDPWAALAGEFGARVVTRMRGHCGWQSVHGDDGRAGVPAGGNGGAG